MGDGNITWELAEKEKLEMENSKEPQPVEHELEDATPRSTATDDDTSTPAECLSPITIPLEVEELHHNTNTSVNTPDLSNASIDNSPIGDKQPSNDTTPRRNGRRNFRLAANSVVNEFGLPLGPAAGLGPQESAPPDSNQAIFSVRGTRSFKINRHRDSVSVFPSGCMGVKDAAAEETPVAAASEPVSSPPSPKSPTIPVGRPHSAARNPLTGEGYNDKDYKRQMPLKKRDGNPLLGQGYDESKNTRQNKVPPGGYSKGLW